MLYEIKHWNGTVLVTQEADSLKSAIELLIGRDADLRDAVLRGADLRGADLRGADLRDVDLRGAVLRGAVLRGADLRGADLRDADLRGAVLRGADLGGADLRGADLGGADLRGAVLRGADLRGADLRDAVLRGTEYYKVPQLHTKILAAIEAGGHLEMGSWHTCETTHCRAGWAINLAGNVGRYMESQYGPALAGALITMASCPWLEKVPDFYANNADALADIKACAEREKAEEAQ